LVSCAFTDNNWHNYIYISGFRNDCLFQRSAVVENEVLKKLGKYLFWCPGCKQPHYVKVEGEHPVWEWNGDMIKPTFSPSIMVRAGIPLQTVCHSFVKDGNIQFLGDCHHELKNQTVPLPILETVEDDLKYYL
jgi:hypothetical protein